MATTVTIEMPAEDPRWPKRCVCCGGLDETDLEVIVPDTVDSHRPIEEVITADIPHCLDCSAHQGIGMSSMQIIAFLVILSLVVAVAWVAFAGHGPAVVVAGLIGIAGMIAVDRFRIRAAMKSTCSSPGQSYKFVHPSGREITTILFLNDDFAREFRAVNGRGVYER